MLDTPDNSLWTQLRADIKDIKNIANISDLDKAARIERLYSQYLLKRSFGYAIPYHLTPGVRDDTIKTNNVTIRGDFLYYTNSASNNVTKVIVAYICIP